MYAPQLTLGTKERTLYFWLHILLPGNFVVGS